MNNYATSMKNYLFFLAIFYNTLYSFKILQEGFKIYYNVDFVLINELKTFLTIHIYYILF